jgi:hypothetical protein
MAKTKRTVSAKRETRALLQAEMAEPRKSLSVRVTEAQQKSVRARKLGRARKQRSTPN